MLLWLEGKTATHSLNTILSLEGTTRVMQINLRVDHLQTKLVAASLFPLSDIRPLLISGGTLQAELRAGNPQVQVVSSLE